MKNLSEFSVKKPFTVLVGLVLVLILGIVSYTKMTVDLIPSINLPYAVVVTTYIGASPEQVETVVTNTVEQTLAAASGLSNINSISAENMSIVIMEYADDTNMDSAVLEMRESLDMVMSFLPEGVGSPMIIKMNPDMLPVQVMTASVADMSPAEAAAYVNDKIVPELKSVDGVASVAANGLISNFVDVTIESDKIEALNKRIADYAQSEYDKAIDAQVDAALPAAKSAARTEVEKAIVSGAQAAAEAQMNLPAGSMDGQITLAAVPDGEKLVAENMPSDEDLKKTIREEVEKAAADAGMSIPETDVGEQITVDMITQILSAQNFSMPAGSALDREGETHSVRVGDKYQSADEIGSQLLFNIEGIGNINLSDVANIGVYDNSGDMYTKVNGENAIMFAISKQSSYSTASVTDAVDEKTAAITAETPDVAFTTLMSQGEYVHLMIDSITANLISGAALAVIVLFLFLRKIRPTLVVSASILFSVVFALVLMYLAGITLNMISMGGLALGIGMLVDNSIVVIENIIRMRAEGASRRDAAIKGAKQVAGAITSSTLTTIVVFVPIVFTTGITKTLFTDMALTIAFSLVASLVIALTLVPAACAGMLSDKMKFKRTFADALAEKYARTVTVLLKHRLVVIVFVLALLGGSIAAVLSAGTELFPAMNSGFVTVSVTIPETATQSERFAMLDEIGEKTAAVEGVDTVGVMDSTGSTDASASLLSLASSGTTVYVTVDEDSDRSTDEIMADIRTATEGREYTVSASASTMDISMLTGSGVSISIAGQDFDDLQSAADAVTDIVMNTPGTIDVSQGNALMSLASMGGGGGSSGSSDEKEEEQTTEVRVIVDKDKAMAKGLTTAQAYLALQTEIAAKTEATSFDDGDGVTYGVYVYDGREDAFTTDDFKNLTIASPTTGEDVKLSDIAAIENAVGYTSIIHDNQERTMQVTASLAPGYDVEAVNDDIEARVAALTLPKGIKVEFGGEMQAIDEAFGDLYLMLLLAIAFIYLVMVAQFQSLKSPFIVMFTLPLAATGGFFALYLTGTPLSIIALIGFVVLVGIIVNNGIVYVDYANQMVAEGMSVPDALAKAAHDRLRPILMTALTTIIALVTMAIDNSRGSEMLRPLAITTIGGMLYGTLLTLFFVPVIYSVFNRKKKETKEETKAE
jgi:multidrug efflux pump subunit AcrB